MSIFYENILLLLNGLLPDLPEYESFYTLNQLLAYIIVVGVIWAFLLKPLLKLLRLSK